MTAIKTLNDRLQLISVIKRGGFGTIYRGFDTVLGKEIAVKEINRELVNDTWYVNQFQNEARHIAKMNHQNIIHIFDLVKTNDGEFYIVMEYIHGLDLRQILKEGAARNNPLPKELATYIISEICKALDYAHSCRNPETNDPLNLVHQDISPSNIMISFDGKVKLIDFGIATPKREVFNNDNKLTLQGKVPYMSPEHVAMEPSLDNRSDLFSLGLVFFELLESKRYFFGEETAKIIERLRVGDFNLNNTINTSAELKIIIEKSMDPLPERRYQNANQFYIDLITYLAGATDISSLSTELTRYFAEITAPAPDNFQDAGLQIPESDLLFDITMAAPDAQSTQLNGNGHAAPQTQSPPDNLDERQAGEDYQTVEHLNGDKPAIHQYAEPNQQDGYDGAVDDIKTEIDVLRLATREESKFNLTRALLGGAVIVLFLILDVFFNWTSLGVAIYDSFFPPLLRVSSSPEGALVYLGDEQIPGATPLSISGFEPGVYELRLEHDQYSPIRRSINIPGKGQVKIDDIEMEAGLKTAYTFNFRAPIEIETQPSGAAVFINGIEYGFKTPCSLDWEVGHPFEVRLEKEGYQALAGLKFNEQMKESIEDKRLWKLEVEASPVITRRITGTFGKYIKINSRPGKSAIYLGDNDNPIGMTGGREFFLSAGQHQLTIKRSGYNAKSLEITIDENTPETLSFSLTRAVLFTAYDVTSSADKPLKVELTRLIRNGKTVLSGLAVPTRINLRPDRYIAVFSRSGYEEFRVEIPKGATKVTARMKPLNGSFTIVVLDGVNNAPLSNVEVRFTPLSKKDEYGGVVDVTDLDGAVSGKLAAGEYVFRAGKKGFLPYERSISIQSGELNLLEFQLARK